MMAGSESRNGAAMISLKFAKFCTAIFFAMLVADQSAWSRDSSRVLYSGTTSQPRKGQVTLTAPAPLAVALDLGNSMRAKLLWQNISAETGYIIERKAAVAAAFTEVAKLPSDNVTYVDTTTTAQSYAYRVRGYRVKAGKVYYSDYSNVATVQTAAPSSGEPAPSSGEPAPSPGDTTTPEPCQ
jgi:hypothetical protein